MGSEASIFGVRVDRDEKGDTNVDVFVAPKYMKKTKHTEKVAISRRRDLKRLVATYSENDEKAHKWAIGRALQDAIFIYFRDVMPSQDVNAGTRRRPQVRDWKTAERDSARKTRTHETGDAGQSKRASEKEAKADRRSACSGARKEKISN